MSIVGRKPKPSTIREATERAKQEQPKRDTSTGAPRLPACPEHLQGIARRAWARFGHEILKMGVMSDADKVALESLCLAYQRLIEAETKVAEMGQLVEDDHGRVVINPYLKIAERAGQDIRAWLSEFGMTPASRTRLRVESAPRRQLVVKPTPAANAEPIDDPRALLRIVNK